VVKGRFGGEGGGGQGVYAKALEKFDEVDK